MATKKPVIPAQDAPAQFMLEKLKGSNLTATDAKQLGYVAYSMERSTELNLQRAGIGFVLPYYAADGTKLAMFRYRYMDTAITTGLAKGTKLRKYDQPFNTDPEVYMPRLTAVNWPAMQKDPAQALIITEGELKAACATKAGYPTVGVGGVYSFGRKGRHQELLPALQEFTWKERPVYICYDSDAITNPKVLIAENRLARVLTDRGAVVYVVRLPPGVQGADKVGLDDYIVANGAKQFSQLLEDTPPWADAEELHRINTEAVYVANPSMVVLLPQPEGPRTDYVTHKVQTFTNEVLANRSITVINPNNGNATKKSAAKEWVQWPNRNQVESVVYEPGQRPILNHALNLWRGWGVQPQPGDITPWHQLLDHVFRSNQHDRKWFEQWLAYPMQYPGTKLKTASVFWSTEQGTGKSIIGYTVGRIYGDNFNEVNKPDLSGSFNGWGVNKQFIMGEEITGGNGRDIADVLKNMITGTYVQVNEKWKPQYSVRNCINYYFTSNHQDAFFINSKDRRYFIQEVVGLLPLEFWQRYDAWYKSTAGTAALFSYLLNFDLTGFDPQAPAPHTISRNAMIEAGLSEQQAWVYQLAEHPDNVLRVGNVVLPYTLYTTEDLMALYAPPDSQTRNRSQRALAIALREAGFQHVNKGEAVDVGHMARMRVWAIRDKRDHMLGLKDASYRYQTERKITGKQPKYK